MAEESKTQTEETSEKKEGKLSGFFKKVGQKLDDAAYDIRLTSDFEKNHAAYTVYTGTSLLAANPEVHVEEHLDENFVLALGEDENIKAGCLIKRNTDGAEVYHIAAVEPAALEIEFEGKTNQRKATKISLGEPAEKVAVIKVGEEFYKI